MTRKIEQGRLIVASHNQGKVVEIGDLLRDFKVEPVSAGALGLPEPDETEDSFIGNAQLKALAAARAANLPALADDSGLCVVALNNDPGIYSARWAEKPDGTRDFYFAMEQVEAALAKMTAPTREAFFVCALCLAWPDGHCEIFEGRVDDTLVWPPRGDKGFGYDPVFLPAKGNLTFGEMEPEDKHAMSHRADAFAQLVAACFE